MYHVGTRGSDLRCFSEEDSPSIHDLMQKKQRKQDDSIEAKVKDSERILTSNRIENEWKIPK
jgi:hypothetical protein